MNKAFLLIGGNMGDRLHHLKTAAAKIAERCGRIVQYSSIYETAAWGKTDQPAFLNQVLLLETSMDPKTLLQSLLAVEQELGRVRQEKLGPRTIDIDILMMEDLVCQDDDLTLPHPALHLRRFALIPLTELAPRMLHPVLNKTIGELLTDCPDTLAVQEFS